MRTRASPPARLRAFTLIEAIMVMVITGVIAGMVAVFIVSPTKGYFDTVRRAELVDAADISLRQLARDVRLALPNSLRVDTTSNANYNYIEFISVSTGGRYRDFSDGSTGGNVLDFSNSANKTFDALGPAPSIASNDYIVVFNLGPGYSPANAYDTPAPGGNRATVSTLSGNTVTLSSNPYAAANPPLPSPSRRFHVVPAAIKAVAYECPKATPGNMKRYWNYGFNSAAPAASPGGNSAIAVSNVTCEVGYSQNVSFRNALLYIKLTITDAEASGEKIEVFQQIHVDNSP